MMRKHKPDELKATATSISLPKSFSAWAAKNTGLTAITKNLIATKVTGLPLEAFSHVYEQPGADNRHHKDPIHQEHLRAARWILESEVQAVYLLQNTSVLRTKLVLEVKWTLTGKITQVLIDFNTSGFVHVIYDQICSDTDQEPVWLNEPLLWTRVYAHQFLNLVGNLPVNHVTFKHAIAYAWVRESFRGDE